MERLTGIIRIMRKGEKRLLRHLYAANTNGEQKLRLKLFNLIEAGKVSTDAEAIMALGEKQSSSAFSHLKTRLREDILNVFLLQESSKRIPQPARAAGLECRKKLAQGYILMLRGAFKEGISVLNSVQLLANKYELPAELVLLNQLFREAVHAIKDIHHLEQVNNDIRVNLDKWNDIIRSEELALAMTMPHILRQGGALEAEIDNDLISELEQLYRNSNSARIGKWYYLAFIEHASTTGRYKDAIKAGLEFIALVENSPSIWSKNDVGGSNQMLGTAYLNTRAFSKAADHLTVADKNFPVAGNNRLMNLELLFRAQMGMGSLQDALITVETALSHPRINNWITGTPLAPLIEFILIIPPGYLVIFRLKTVIYNFRKMIQYHHEKLPPDQFI